MRGALRNGLGTHQHYAGIESLGESFITTVGKAETEFFHFRLLVEFGIAAAGNIETEFLNRLFQKVDGQGIAIGP